MSSELSLTPAQHAAIDELSQPLQLIACAGSGKTEVLAHRIANILAQPGITPANVIAFTFTDKAAAELKERIYRTVITAIPDIVGLAEMYVGTMHGYCLDLLQTYVPETFKYGVLTDITQQLLIDRESRNSGLTTCTKIVSGQTTTLSRWKDTRQYKGALSVLQEDAVDFGLVPAAVTASLASYQGLLFQRKYFDYTSMMVDAVGFLERSQTGTALDTSEQSLRDHVERDVKFVIVDEYQDVNPIQEKLVERLIHFGANLCVVGDDDQTIYQWRGSEVDNIITFASRYAGVRTIELADNFRSSEGIVELKYLLDCPYQFKLRFMYGFNPPIHEALGYGKGLHDVLAEMHKRALEGDIPTKAETEDFVDRHLHTPYAYPSLRDNLRASAVQAIDRYFDRHGDDLSRTIHSEKQIEVEVSPGVTVNGRIDLIKSLVTGEIAIVDFKSTEHSQAEEVTKDQLSIYALGYEQLTGDNADRIQILNLDDRGTSTNDPVNPALIAAIREKVDLVAREIRDNQFACTHDHSSESAYDDLVWLTTGGRAS